MANTPHSEPVPQSRPVPDELAAGLDLFAATWLQQWADAGGSVHLDASGKASLGFPMYEDSPGYVEPAADQPEWLRKNQRTFLDAHYHGKMRAMLAIIEALPCGYEALKAHMQEHGMRSYFGKVGAAS